MDSYIQVIKTSIVFFPVIALVFTLPYILFNYHKYGSIISFRIVIVYSFILYLLTAFFLVSLPLPTYEYVAQLDIPRAQLQPLAFVHDILKDAHVVWDEPRTWLTLIRNQAFYQFAFNVIMTVPFGMYLRYYFKCRWWSTLLWSFALSLFFEISQLTGLFFLYPRNYRLFDVDDLLANSLGGLLGWCLVTPFLYILPSRHAIDRSSYQRGEKVSLLRRACALLVDVFFYDIVYILFPEKAIPGLNQIPDATPVLCLGICFIVIPLLLRGRTIGMLVNSTRLIEDRHGTCSIQAPRPGAILLRYGLLLGFVFGVPWLMQSGLNWIPDNVLPSVVHSLLYLLLLALYIAGWGSIGLSLLAGRLPFYGKLSHTRIVSAIRTPE